jgi:hypothetical protein
LAVILHLFRLQRSCEKLTKAACVNTRVARDTFTFSAPLQFVQTSSGAFFESRSFSCVRVKKVGRPIAGAFASTIEGEVRQKVFVSKSLSKIPWLPCGGLRLQFETKCLSTSDKLRHATEHGDEKVKSSGHYRRRLLLIPIISSAVLNRLEFTS